MSAETDVHEWVGLKVVDPEGDGVGEVENVYGDESGGWLMLKAGLLGRKSFMVPSNGAEANGDQLQVAYSKDQIKDSPEVPGDGAIDEEFQDALHAHYGGGAAPAAAPGNEVVTENVDGTERPPVESTEDRPVTHGEDDEIRDPESGTRRDVKDMVLPEHHEGIRPHPSEDPEVESTGEITAPTRSGTDADES